MSQTNHSSNEVVNSPAARDVSPRRTVWGRTRARTGQLQGVNGTEAVTGEDATLTDRAAVGATRVAQTNGVAIGATSPARETIGVNPTDREAIGATRVAPTNGGTNGAILPDRVAVEDAPNGREAMGTTRDIYPRRSSRHVKISQAALDEAVRRTLDKMSGQAAQIESQGRNDHARHHRRQEDDAAEHNANGSSRLSSIIVGPNGEQPRVHFQASQVSADQRADASRSENAENHALRQELQQMQAQLQTLTTQMHRATSAAPELETVLAEARRSPFTARVSGVRVKHNPDNSKNRPIPYDGKGDPTVFLKSMTIHISRLYFSPEEADAGSCQLFVESLSGEALNWFSRLEANSIDGYEALTSAFLQHHQCFMRIPASNADLWRMYQKRDESLRTFMDRFKDVVSRLSISDESAIGALKNALARGTRFKDDLTILPVTSLGEVLARANRYILVEEDRGKRNPDQPGTVEKASEKAQDSKGKAVDEYYEPRQHYNKDFARGEKGRKATMFAIDGKEQPNKSWNKWHREADNPRFKGKRPYCEFHRFNGHSTEECKTLQMLLLNKYKKGGVAVERERRKVVTHKDNQYCLRDEQQHDRQHEEEAVAQDDQAWAQNDREREVARLPPPLKRNHEAEEHNEPPAPRRRINMIMGGLSTCRDSVRSIQAYCRETETKRNMPSHSNMFKTSTVPITFTEEDARNASPNNDPLVVEMVIVESSVTRILIDTGSSVNVIFKYVLIQMEIDLRNTVHETQPLTGFDGDTIMTIGTITLPIYVGGTMQCFNFAIVDKPIVYNVILGTPWLHKRRAVASTYHQCVKFPNAYGIYTLRGDPLMARTCFIIEKKMWNARAFVIAESTPPRDPRTPPPKESVIQVNIDLSDPKRCVGIGAELPMALRDELIQFLRKNATTFAWTIDHMTGIDPSITSHELNVDPTYKPVKQKRRKLGAERTTAVNDEVRKLLDAGSITELVEATAENELLSFMDAFSGYNQIMMHKDDREKTAFITEQGTFCYRVMPFVLKNAGATYQRLVNRMFASQLGRTMEVYIDDMLVKSAQAADHVAHLKQCFEILNKYSMKLNPAKCTFGVTSGEFLGYLVTKRGIEANPKQISAIINLPSPRNTRELLRGNKRFEWDEKCELAFTQLKDYLSSPPVLAKPEQGETLYLYIAISCSAVSGVLVREDRREQHPIFYVSKTLDGAELRYPTLEKLAYAVVISARKLRPYFQSHTVEVLKNQPLRTILHSPSQSGRLAKWAVELSEYDIEYKNHTCAKSQVLADFLVELSPELEADTPPPDIWSLHVDGASSKMGSGAGVRLTSPTGEILEQSFRLAFTATNNDAEYEALIAGLRLGVKKIQAYCDSQLVTHQFSGDYATRHARMDAYLKVVRDLSQQFEFFELVKIPRSDNAPADALATLASTSDPDLRRVIPVECIDQPSIDVQLLEVALSTEASANPSANSAIVLAVTRSASTASNANTSTTPVPAPIAVNPSTPATLAPAPVSSSRDDWQTEIIAFIADGIMPKDKWEARRLRVKSAHYTMLDGSLFRWEANGALLICVNTKDVNDIMREVHEGAGGNHSGGRAFALRIRRNGLFWPTMVADCTAFASKCEKCQRHAPFIHSPTELLRTMSPSYPFMRWAMDIVGPLTPSRQKKYLLIITDYFTKWVEAESYASLEANEVQNFIWKNIICRHGLPYEIICDNRPQIISLQFEGFCAGWRIRLSKSTPRYPQGNGQTEATNKTILADIKKRLDEKKGLWADELDGVLWSHRTSPRTSTGRTPFSLVYGMEALAPAEVGIPTLRRSMLVHDPELNNKMLCDRLLFLEEERDQALLRIQNYQQAAAKFYNKKV
ncbi:PREDICTED: uncharacterized protein LOC104759673 [Camelina sativa]|uniref:Uncharacterized protein LOC104759673 n=1 Tax=Camelina sativa TaxID=90675 RepID=A0ABM0X571_CAMSA|nr:PREDICTED: uncharacterized protein LOC104759673 [Camelina sativa]